MACPGTRTGKPGEPTCARWISNDPPRPGAAVRGLPIRPLAAASRIPRASLPEERAGHLEDETPRRHPLLALFILLYPECGVFSRYACASLPPDPSGLLASKTPGGSAHTSQPDLWGIHLIHNRWPGVHRFAI